MVFPSHKSMKEREFIQVTASCIMDEPEEIAFGEGGCMVCLCVRCNLSYFGYYFP